MDIPQAIQQCALNIEPAAIVALIKQESNFKPYQIGVNHSEKKLQRQPSNHDEAVAWSTQLIQSGYSIDMGLMQINSANLKKLGLTVNEVFDPCTNLKAGAQILFENYQRASLKYGHGEKAFHSALSAYNTGNFNKGFKNGYVRSVLKHLKKGHVFSAQHNITLPKAEPLLLPKPQKTPPKIAKSSYDMALEKKLRQTYLAE